MSGRTKADAERLMLMLSELRLPATKVMWSTFAERADTEGWTAERFLSTLMEHEVVEREQRRLARFLNEANLLTGKSLVNFDFNEVPMISKAQFTALAEGDGWIDNGDNVLLFGPPGRGKSHLASALGLALFERGWRVLMTRTGYLVQRLQVARRDLGLEVAIGKLDKYHLLILDDLAYVAKDQAETSVLFELISARYERRSVLVPPTNPLANGHLCSPTTAVRSPLLIDWYIIQRYW